MLPASLENETPPLKVTLAKRTRKDGKYIVAMLSQVLQYGLNNHTIKTDADKNYHPKTNWQFSY